MLFAAFMATLQSCLHTATQIRLNTSLFAPVLHMRPSTSWNSLAVFILWRSHTLTHTLVFSNTCINRQKVYWWTFRRVRSFKVESGHVNGENTCVYASFAGNFPAINGIFTFKFHIKTADIKVYDWTEKKTQIN